MTFRRRAALLALPFLLAPLAGACALDPLPEGVGGMVSIDRPAGCNPFGSSDACLYPFPSSFHQVADDATPTGQRVAISASLIPQEQVGVANPSPPLDLTPYNRADGFSPVSPIVLHFGVDVDTTGLASIHTIGDSVLPEAKVALLDMETGKRVAHFVEMDANRKDGWDGRYAFIVRPAEPMEMGHRHAVLIRGGLTDVDGNAIEPTPAFAALRDGRPTDNADVEAVRARTEEVFAFAAEQGYARSELLLAFDLQVASEDWLLGSVLSMREEALAAVERDELAYTIDQVEDDPNADIARIVYGTFEVPAFVREDDTFAYDDAHHPVRQAEDRSYPFTMLVPEKAKAGEPLPLVVLGHGIFGNGRDFLTGGDGQAIQELAQEFGAVVIATDWIGLSSNDLSRIANEVAPNLNRLPLITDQLQQSLVNVLVMTKLGMGPLAADEALTFGDAPLVDPTRVWYWGASLGGIQGTSYISMSPDISRAVFGVPGSAWSTMLTRSIVFPPIKLFIEPRYPDPLDLTFLMTVAQSAFDHSDPANLGTMMFKRPLADAPSGRTVIFQEAIGDSQVPNLATDILVRAVGAKLLEPSIYQPYGIEPVSAPTSESVVVQVQMEGFDDPLPPDTNTPPDGENGVHHAMNFLPHLHAQIAALFTGGTVVQTCSGTCDPN